MLNDGAGAPAEFRAALGMLAGGAPLCAERAEAAFLTLMRGEATPAQVGALLMALRVRGETVEEIAGATRAMRAHMTSVRAPAGAIDTCGTGGDAKGTFNVSTAAAFIVAGCGVPVAKHGNKALSSKSGSADVLRALGVELDVPFGVVERCIAEVGVGFMMAPKHHGAMRHVAGARAELGTRTIFNLLGPLANPAGVKFQLLGVFSREWLTPVAEVLRDLGTERAWVVHGEDGMDELTTTGASSVAALADGTIRRFEVGPEDAGLPRASEDDLKGGRPEDNAAALRALLAGEHGPYRDIVLLNAAAALIVAGVADDLVAGVARATRAIDDGGAAGRLDALVRLTNTKPDGRVAPIRYEFASPDVAGALVPSRRRGGW